MVALKRWHFEVDSLTEISNAYFKQHALKRIQADDLLMARSGEGTIGKVALVPEGVNGVCADFIIRMRPDPTHIRPSFLRYCLMSSFYQHLVYGEKKGLGNNTNIFPVQVHEFPLLAVPFGVQDRICDQLDAAMRASDVNVQRARQLRIQIQNTLDTALAA